jgi:hypothetical protein
MSREVHVRFCESRGVRFPPATHLVVLVHGTEADTEALCEEIPSGLEDGAEGSGEVRAAGPG